MYTYTTSIFLISVLSCIYADFGTILNIKTQFLHWTQVFPSQKASKALILTMSVTIMLIWFNQLEKNCQKYQT